MPSSDVFRMLNGEANNLDAGQTDGVHARARNEVVGVQTFELHRFGVNLVGFWVGYFCFGNIFARVEAQVICHADSDCLHETVFITLLSSVLLDDVENHTIGGRQPYSECGFHRMECV